MMKKMLTLLMASLLIASTVSVKAVCSDDGAAAVGKTNLHTKDYYRDIMKREITFVKRAALDCGAIGMYAPAVSDYAGMELPAVDGISPDEYKTWRSAKVMPYFSDTAVLGVIRADRAMGTAEGKEVCLNYIDWYISRMNTAESDVNGVAGTVYDYYIFQSDDGRTVSLPLYDAYASQYEGQANPYDYDSTDSYAALFLQILFEYADVYDSTFLEGREDVVDALINVLEATYVPTLGLTYAKPSYAVCYMMDNCEVYCGYVEAAKIYSRFFGNEEKAEQCRRRAETVQEAICTAMWDGENNAFLAAVDTSGNNIYDGNDLTVFYPQATCQLFPVLFGVISPDDPKAVLVYDRFKEMFCGGRKGSDWLNIDAGGAYPWCILLRAVIAMGDLETADSFLSTVKGRYIGMNHTYPYYCAEWGHVLVSATELYALAPDDDFSESSAEPEESSQSDGEQPESSAGESVSADPEKKSGSLGWIIGGALAVAAVTTVTALKRRKK